MLSFTHKEKIKLSKLEDTNMSALNKALLAGIFVMSVLAASGLMGNVPTTL